MASCKNSTVALCLGIWLRRMGQDGGIVPEQSSPCTHHVPRHPSIYFPRLRDVARLTPPQIPPLATVDRNSGRRYIYEIRRRGRNGGR